LVSRRVIENVLERIPIEQIVGEYVELRRSGSQYRGRCPFHEETKPSFYVRPEAHFFHCFGCQKSGDTIRFLMEIEGRSFMEALQDLAARAGVEIPESELKTVRRDRQDDARRERHMRLLDVVASLYHRVLVEYPEARAARDYLEKRKISAAAIKRFRLGFAPPRWDFLVEHLRSQRISPQDGVDVGILRPRRGDEGYYDWFRGRVMFPISSPGGKVIGFSGRVLPGSAGEDDEAKYINTPETAYYHKGSVIYGLHLAAPAIRRQGRVYLVEGNFDLVAMSQAGFENVVAPMGTALTAEQVSRLGRLGAELVFVFDGDRAGREAAIRASEVVTPAGRAARIAVLPASEDPASLIVRKGREAMQEVLASATEMGRFVIREVARAAGDSDGRKVDAVRRLWSMLGRTPDPMLRDLYIKHVAREFAIDEALVRKHVGMTGGRRSTAPEPPARPDAGMDAPVEVLELVGAVMDHPQIAPQRFEEIEQIEIAHRGLLGLLHIVRSHGRDEAIRKLRETLTTAGDEPYKRWVSERFVRPQYATPEEALRAFDDCHAKIVRRSIERKLQDLRQEMDEAIRAGNTDRLKDLAREQTRLNRLRIKPTTVEGELAG